MAEKSLIQFILDLLRDPEALAEFKDNPQGVMSACGLANVSPEEVHDAIAVISDNDDVSFDREYNTGGNHVAGANTPPPPPPAHHDDHDDHDDHDAGVKYLDKYITNNYVTNNVDDRDTIIDQSVNQNIDTDGGDFSQTIENNSVNATGDGAVAAGDDISDSTITTGNQNVVGDGNEVINGDDNTTAFGSGSAVSDVSVDDGSAFTADGDAGVDNSVNDSYNEDNSQDNDVDLTVDSNNTDTDSSIDNSGQDNDGLDIDGDIDVNAALLP